MKNSQDFMGKSTSLSFCRDFMSLRIFHQKYAEMDPENRKWQPEVPELKPEVELRPEVRELTLSR